MWSFVAYSLLLSFTLKNGRALSLIIDHKIIYLCVCVTHIRDCQCGIIKDGSGGSQEVLVVQNLI